MTTSLRPAPRPRPAPHLIATRDRTRSALQEVAEQAERRGDYETARLAWWFRESA